MDYKFSLPISYLQKNVINFEFCLSSKKNCSLFDISHIKNKTISESTI